MNLSYKVKLVGCYLLLIPKCFLAGAEIFLIYPAKSLLVLFYLYLEILLDLFYPKKSEFST